MNYIVYDLVELDSKFRLSAFGNRALDLDVAPPLLAARICTDYVCFI